MATQTQVKAFIERIAPIAQAKSKGRALPSVCIAQACCESAYGTSPKMIRANAVFGIKVGKSKVHFGTAWHDKAYSTRTKECYDGKTYTNITDLFRAYDSIDDAVEDYYDMLGTCKRYKASFYDKKFNEFIYHSLPLPNPDFAQAVDSWLFLLEEQAINNDSLPMAGFLLLYIYKDSSDNR